MTCFKEKVDPSLLNVTSYNDNKSLLIYKLNNSIAKDLADRILNDHFYLSTKLSNHHDNELPHQTSFIIDVLRATKERDSFKSILSASSQRNEINNSNYSIYLSKEAIVNYFINTDQALIDHGMKIFNVINGNSVDNENKSSILTVDDLFVC